MKKISLISIFLLLILLTSCSSQKEEKIELTISAAASMQEALTQIKNTYEKEHSNVRLFFNFGASGALQQQIANGAPVDLFLSAAQDKFNLLVNKGSLDEAYTVDLVGNDLVLIQNKQAKFKLKGFEELNGPQIKHIAIGTPESVPAGSYAKETLTSLNLWQELNAKLIFAKDVRQVLTYVETGNVDAGIVYKTDALHSKKVDMIAKADAGTHSPIVYPLGVIKNSLNKKEAIQFYQFMQSKQALKVFEGYGFTSLIKE